LPLIFYQTPSYNSVNQKTPLIALLSGSLLLSSCSLAHYVSKNDSESLIPIKSFDADDNQTQLHGLPEFGHNSVLEPETFVLEYNKVAEVASLLGEGKASWYGSNFHGRRTASGEPYDMHKLTAAHPTLPFNTLVWVENKLNERKVLVRVNDRGPYTGNRIIDLSRKAAEALGMTGAGLAEVNLYLARKGAEDQLAKKAADTVYTIQLGTFETGKEALAFAESVDGARVEVIGKSDSTSYGVFYGLFADRREAFQKQRKLEEQAEIVAFVKELAV